MQDNRKTKKQLIEELVELRQRVNESESGSRKNSVSSKMDTHRPGGLADSLDDIRDGLVQLNKLGTILDVNQAAADISGMSKEELIGKHFTQVGVFSAKDIPSLLRQFKDLLCGGERDSGVEIVNKAGQVMVLESSATVQTAANGSVSIIIMVRDITERKKAEDAVLESENKYRTLFEKSADAILIIEGDQFVDCNEATVQMLGYKNKQELLETHPSELSPEIQPDGKSSFTKANEMMSIAFEKGSHRFEWDHKRHNGEVFPVEVLLTAVPFKGRNFLHVVWRDITERKRAENALRELVKSTSSRYGSDFFESVVLQLSKILDADYMLIGEFQKDPHNSIKTIAATADGQLVENLVYELAGTPCENVVGKSVCTYRTGVADMFPEDVLLKEMGVQGYIGMPLFDSHHNASGLVVALYRNPIEEQEFKEAFIQVFSSRIESELQRSYSDKALRKSEERFRTIYENAPVLINAFDENGGCVLWNKQCTETFGWTIDEINAHGDALSLFYPDPVVRDEVMRTVTTDPDGHFREWNPMTKEGKTLTAMWANFRLPDGMAFNLGYDITERKLAEEALRESETRLSQIAETIEDVFWITDWQSHQTLFASHAYEKIWGRPLHELYDDGRNWANAIHEDDRQRAWENFVKLGEGNTYDEEYRILRSDGSLRWIRDRGFPVRNAQGEIYRVAGIAQDITERKRAEEALRESEEKYRTLFEDSPAMLHSIDQNGTIVSVTDKWLETLGYEKGEVLGRNSTEFLTPESKKHAIDVVLPEFFKRGYCKDISYQFQKKNGDVIDVLLSATSEKDSEGNTFRSIASLVNVTKRKQAEEALRESEEKFRTYVSSAPDAIFIADAEGRYVEVNAAACRVTGYSESELLNLSIPDLLMPDMLPDAGKRFEQFKKTGRDRTELKHKRKDGSIIWMSVDAVALSEDRFMAFCSDITETKRLQELESRAERLKVAGTIAGQVAHDFNNLLAPLMAYPDFIREELHEHSASIKYLDQIEKAAQKIAEINQDLLAMGRRGHFNQEPLNLNKIIQHALSELDSSPETLTRKTYLDDDLLDIMGGGAQLHRMISNLLHNAKDAMQNVGQITVKTENYYVDDVSVIYGRVPKGEYIKFTISDTGCGIPDDIVQKIFDPFFSSKAADKKRGSGLGMSVVDAVVKDHHGYIDMSTKVGEGTSFYIYFPITRKPVGSLNKSEACGGSETILVVDDDNIQREVTSQLLTKLGYRVCSVESGELAIEFLRENSRDLVILDMVMPGGIDGAETYRQILEFGPHQKAIILSGFSETDRVIAARKLGAGTFVKKPITSQTIAAAVRTELDSELKPAIIRQNAGI